MFTYILGIVATVAVLAIIIQLVRSDRLKERQAIWWIIVSLLSVVASVFPESLEFVSDSMGIEVPANLAFFVAIGLLCVVTLQLSADVNKLDEKVRTLAERISILEWESKQQDRH